MADVIYLALVIGFFALMVLLVKACDHIIGPEDHLSATDSSATSVAPGASEVAP